MKLQKFTCRRLPFSRKESAVKEAEKKKHLVLVKKKKPARETSKEANYSRLFLTALFGCIFWEKK